MNQIAILISNSYMAIVVLIHEIIFSL